jgi:divalent metal cation (Fe/Co/Zn/Cd) transporter
MSNTQSPMDNKAHSSDSIWQQRRRWVLLLSFSSLIWMGVEGGVGVVVGYASKSTALVGWALSSAIEGLASVIVIWRYTGTRTRSETSERTAQKGVAISFWLLAPYVAFESLQALRNGEKPGHTLFGIILTGASVIVMPVLGWAKNGLGQRLGSAATAGEGRQNLLCAATAAAVLIGLAANTAFGAWWLDPLIGLVVAMLAVREGRAAWRGEQCC